MTDAPTAPRRVAVRVTRDAERQLRGGHPWLYESSIRSASHEGEPGDLAVVFDHERRFIAIGLWDPTSPIRVKVLHAGPPVTIDESWWRARFAEALALRAPLDATRGTDRETNGYRVVNGESDGLPGLVIDRYDDVVVVKLYAACWFAHLDTIVPILQDLTGARSVVLRLARRLDGPANRDDGALLAGAPVRGEVMFTENGLRFGAEVVGGHKTGHFLDQRDNRQRVRELASNKTVLDVFSCTGGFSVYAAAGGATAVTSVDISSGAVSAIERNLAANRGRREVAACAARQIVGDAFRVMDDLIRARERFDLVVVDPPSFAQNQAGIDKATRAYLRLNRLAMNLVRPGGVLVSASCSSRVSADLFFDLVYEAADAERCRLDEIGRTGHALDHPITFEHGAYLKAIFARVRR